MANEIEEMEKKVEIARLSHAILESELRIVKKKKEIEEIEKTIEKYKLIMAEKGA